LPSNSSRPPAYLRYDVRIVTNPVAEDDDRSNVSPPTNIEVGPRRVGRVLVADDDRVTRSVVRNILNGAGHEVIEVQDGQAAVERVGLGGVDIVLLDVVMPRLSGLEACRILKNLSADRFLPVILLTVRSDASSRVEGLRIGADDYVCKPFDPSELLARVDSMLRIKELHDQVRRGREKLEVLSFRDPLTGVYNYRYIQDRLQEEFRRAERYQEPLACALVDVDGLASFNQVSREVGDRTLRRVSKVLESAIRDVDVLARLGEDEFLLVLPSTHFIGSVKVAERVWTKARGIERETAVRSSRVTLSIGAAMYPSRDVRTKEGLLKGAGVALREAKRAGGNRVCIFRQDGYVYTAVSETTGGSPRVDGQSVVDISAHRKAK
jgi:two-component system, cell cycle response regulator